MPVLPRRFLCLVCACAAVLLGAAGSASAASLPTGFQESTQFTGLLHPTNIEFSPDGRVFVAEKSGVIKVFEGLGDATPTTFADLSVNVHNFWDRGMLGMALPPNFPADPYVYVLYTHDAAIGDTAPRWGGGISDGCSTPPGPTGDGCVVSGRLSRLRASGNTMTGSEEVLIEDWCQQYPSHSVGDLGFGADGKLYVSAGDGASFNFTDYGQDGSPLNPCGDPPGGVGATLTPPSAEGGALRSQDVRTDSSGGSTGETVRLRPDTDVRSDWIVAGGASTAWDALNEDVAPPSAIPAESFLYDSAQGSVTEVGLASTDLGGTAPTGGKAWFYMDTAPGQEVRADVIWGGSVRASRTVGTPSGTTYQWHSIDVVPPTQAAVDDLRLRFTITTAGSGTADVFAAFFELNAGGGGWTDPDGLDGTILRIDPATGAGASGNPLAADGDPNARRMVAYGLRNPFRFAIRPGTNEVWLGDVGWNGWEEINRITNPADGALDNFGWPCYEGSGRQSGYDSANLNLCESLYSAPNVSAPYYAWSHSGTVVAGETCPTGSSSAAGVDFYTGGPYPDGYDGAIFFADYSRDCIWAMQPSSPGGLPSPSRLLTFAAGAENPVDVKVGPGGELFYADFDGGTIRRISFAGANQPPSAVATANPTSGPAPLNVQFDGTGSGDPDPGDTLTYAWDLDGDGSFDDSTAVNPTHTYAGGTYTVRLRVSDSGGASATSDPITITAGAGNTPPQATITAPPSGTQWQVGQAIGFAGSATDAQDGALAASRFSWRLDLEHCPSNCHTHTLQTYPAVTSGSFVGPDHEYPSHLNLRLTVTDSGGLTDTEVIRLDPRTVAITLASSPGGFQLGFNAITGTASFTRTVILGSSNTISAPSPQSRGRRTYAFSTWSDGGAQTHNITAAASATYTATYRRVSGKKAAAACTKKAKKKKKSKKKKKKRCGRNA